MQGTPKRPDPKMPGTDAPIRVTVKGDDPTAEVEEMRRNRAEESHRSVYLKREDFEKHGYTPGCEGCRRVKSGAFGYKHHTPECRKRMKTKLGEERHPRFERALECRLEAQEASG